MAGGVQITNVIRGDFTADDNVNDEDVFYLLFNTMYGDEEYPLNQDGDFTKDGIVNDEDVFYLLFNTMYGDEEYPLN